jgi:hypothetical protein
MDTQSEAPMIVRNYGITGKVPLGTWAFTFLCSCCYARSFMLTVPPPTESYRLLTIRFYNMSVIEEFKAWIAGGSKRDELRGETFFVKFHGYHMSSCKNYFHFEGTCSITGSYSLCISPRALFFGHVRLDEGGSSTVSTSSVIFIILTLYDI